MCNRQKTYLFPLRALVKSLQSVSAGSSSIVPFAHIDPLKYLARSRSAWRRYSQRLLARSQVLHQSLGRLERTALRDHQPRDQTSSSEKYRRRKPTIPPAKKPPIAWLYASSFSRKLAAAIRVNSKVPPIAAVGESAWPSIQGLMTLPNIPIVPPVLVMTPHPVTFCRVRVFCTAERKSPAPPRIIVDLAAALMASLGW